MSKISIFVSSRNEIDSIYPINNIYIPIKCGAVFNKKKKKEYIGDDTGDNISNLSKEFSEYTVMYWMWKNYKSDYYGLCHYRRYLSFNDNDLEEFNNIKAPFKLGVVESMSEANMQYAGILDVNKMRSEIEKNDIITSYEYNILDYIPNVDKNIKTVRQKWEIYNRAYMKRDDFDLLLEIIKDKAPNYYKDSINYMNGTKFRGFNCFVMKKDIFFEMCEFIFPILFEFHKRIKRSTNNSDFMDRKTSYAGEWLYSIFVDTKKREKINIQERQLIIFQNTEKEKTVKFEKNTIPIIFSATLKNIPYIAASIESIINNTNKKTKIKFIIIHSGKTIDGFYNEYKMNNFVLLEKMVKNHKNVAIEFYNPTESLKEIDVRKYGEDTYEEKMYLSLLPWIINKYKKAIYCNESTIFDCDINDLYKQKINGNYCKAAIDIYTQICLNGYNLKLKDYLKNILDIQDEKYYSISTVILDLDYARKKFKHKEIIDKCIKMRNLSESDIFNSIYHNSIERLDSSWCAFDNLQYEYPTYREFIPKYILNERKKQKAYSIKNHNKKNLLNESYSYCMFCEYISMTPFKYVILEGKENILVSLYEKDKEIDLRSKKRKLFDKYLPLDSKRRKIFNYFLPANSKRITKLKKIFSKIEIRR